MRRLLLAVLTTLTGFTGIIVGSIPDPDINKLKNYAQKHSIDFESEDAYEKLLEDFSSARVVLLGEATHGTLEFYEIRKSLSKKLIENQGFDFIVVEGDWPAHMRLNRYVKGDSKAESIDEVFSVFDRWPEWMWRNEVYLELAKWLRETNREREYPVGIYGMDIYDIERAYRRLHEIVEEEAPEVLSELTPLTAPLKAYISDMHSYARNYSATSESLEAELLEAYNLIVDEILPGLSPDKALELERNASNLIYSERHFRAMVDRNLNNWNIRVDYMRDTLLKLLEHYGEGSRGILWAHNTHIGDARATTMARYGQYNIGQLAREELGIEQVRILGFGLGGGEVKAGRGWGSPGEIMKLPDPLRISYEFAFKKMDKENFLIVFDESTRNSILMNPRGQRAVGVVYNPESEVNGNLVLSVLPVRYDAFIFLRNTQPLRLLRFNDE